MNQINMIEDLIMDNKKESKMSFNIIADYHTHTIDACGMKLLKIMDFHHAKGTVRENALAALKRGLSEIAITNHGREHNYGIRGDYYSHMRNLIDEINEDLAQQNKRIKILLGVECNLLTKNGDLDIDDKELELLDILCVGYHPGAIKGYMSKFFYQDAMINSLQKYDITIINHPTEHVSPDLIEIGRMALKKNTAIEINEKHQGMDSNIIQELKSIGVKFSLGSDAHNFRRVGLFDNAKALARKAGLTNDDIINANGVAHNNMKLLRG